MSIERDIDADIQKGFKRYVQHDVDKLTDGLI